MITSLLLTMHLMGDGVTTTQPVTAVPDEPALVAPVHAPAPAGRGVTRQPTTTPDDPPLTDPLTPWLKANGFLP
jgi:hypothetical protein